MRLHMTKWLSTKLDRADQESNWFSVIMYRPTYALPVFHDRKLNIPQSGPPTQSLTIYLYMIIATWWFQKSNLIGWLFRANEHYSPLGAKIMHYFETGKNNSWDLLVFRWWRLFRKTQNGNQR